MPSTVTTNIDPFMIRIDAGEELTISASTPLVPMNEEFYVSLFFTATGEFDNAVGAPAVDQPTDPIRLHSGNWTVTITDDETTGKLQIMLESEPDGSGD